MENAVGAHLLNDLQGPSWSVTCWRGGGQEVDFVVAHGARTWVVEVKSGRSYKAPGLSAFRQQYPNARPLIVGDTSVGLERFFSSPAQDWFN